MFSRITAVIVLIIIQLLLCLFIFFSFYAIPHADHTITALLLVIEIVLSIIIVNHKGSPELKIPWFLIIIIFPFLGILCYLFFANHGLSRKQRKNLDDFRNETKFICKNEDVFWLKRIEKECPEYLGIFKYLNNTQRLNGYDGNKVTYFENGESFFPDLLDKLKQAKSFILIEFFIIKKGDEWNKIRSILFDKVKQGVKVNLLYDDFGSASTLQRRELEKLREGGINAYRFNPFRPILSGIFNNRDHRKIVVIDHKYGYTGGINIGDEYSNKISRFGYWKDSMIRIEGPAIKNLIMLFFSTFDMNRQQLSDYSYYVKGTYKQCGDSLVFPFGDGPIQYINDYISEQTFINLINSARKSIIISTPYFIPTYCLMQAIKNAGKRGIDVKLLIPGKPDKKIIYLLTKANIKSLLESGIRVFKFCPGFNHEKAVVIDNKIAFVGSTNMDYRSLVHHFECGAIIYRSNCINEITNSLENCIQNSEEIEKDFKINIFKRLLCNLLLIIAPLL